MYYGMAKGTSQAEAVPNSEKSSPYSVNYLVSQYV